MAKLFSFLAMLMFMAGGCSVSKITSSWRAPDAEPKKYNKLMVLGIIREPDRSYRIEMEKHLVNDLKTLGYNAFSAYEQYGPKAFNDLTEEQATMRLAAEGIDAVLTIVLLDKKKERYYVPSQVIYSPYIVYHSRFWGYYISMQYRIQSPDYYQSTQYFWESNFYDLSKAKLLYSLQTQTFDPSNVSSMAHEYGQLIVNALLKDRILLKQPAGPVKPI